MSSVFDFCERQEINVFLSTYVVEGVLRVFRLSMIMYLLHDRNVLHVFNGLNDLHKMLPDLHDRGCVIDSGAPVLQWQADVVQTCL